MLERLKHIAKMIDWIAGIQLASILVPGVGYVINGTAPSSPYYGLLSLSVSLYVLLEALVIFFILKKVDELATKKDGTNVKSPSKKGRANVK